MKKLTKKQIAIFLCLVSCLALLAGCSGSKNVDLTLTIDGSAFNFDSTVQDLYDAGFVICDTAYGKITSEWDLPQLESRIVDTVSQYYVGRPIDSSMADFTGVVIKVYNPGKQECSFKDASIFYYGYQYDPASESTISVLFNDANFAGLDMEEGVAAMENIGITFDKEDKAEFVDKSTNQGYGWSLLTGSSKYTYFISRDKDANGSLYVDEIYFEKKLNVEYK